MCDTAAKLPAQAEGASDPNFLGWTAGRPFLSFVASNPHPGATVTTLHIEHSISNLQTWRAAFARFAEVRARFGVRAERVRHPVDDPLHLILDLDFDSEEEAGHFLAFLEENVWSSTDKAPALVGTPSARVLTDIPS